MAGRRRPLAGGRNPLLVVGVLLLLMLGLCAMGAALGDRQLLREAAAERSHLPAIAGVPDSSSAPLAVRDRIQNDSTCHFGQSDASRPKTGVVAAIGDDPRDYLSKTAALRYRHREATAAALDPYQVSLNASVYLAGDATLPEYDRSPMPVAPSQHCSFP